MNGFFLLVPFFMIRFGLLAAVSRDGIARAAQFAPMFGAEKAAYWVYQISNAAILAALCFLTVRTEAPGRFCAGLVLYLLGLLLCAGSVWSFAKPGGDGCSRTGVYRISRNPMYVAYFLLFLGCAVLTGSPLLGGIVLVFQASAHWVILAEERWCLAAFGASYEQYRKQVRRYP